MSFVAVYSLQHGFSRWFSKCTGKYQFVWGDGVLPPPLIPVILFPPSLQSFCADEDILTYRDGVSSINISKTDHILNQYQYSPQKSLMYMQTTVKCDTFLGRCWWSWAFSLFAWTVCILSYNNRQFRYFKAAVWSFLAGSCIENTLTIDHILDVSLQVAGPLEARTTAVYVGFALASFFYYLMMFVGSAKAYSQDRGFMGGAGAESKIRRLTTLQRALSNAYQKTDVASKLFVVTQILAWIGVVISLGGIAALQSECYESEINTWEYGSSRRAITIGEGTFGPEYKGDPALGRPKVKCSTVMSNFWWAWALSVTTLVLVGLSWKTAGWLAKFKAATFAMIICSSMYAVNVISQCHYIVNSPSPITQGMRTAATVAYAGVVILVVGLLLTILTGSAYAYASSNAGNTSMIKGRGQKPSKISAKHVFLALQGIAWCAQIVSLVGLALSTAYFTYIFPTLEYNGSEYIHKVFIEGRFNWYVWALQFVTLASLAVTWNAGHLREYNGAVWMVAVTAITLNMQTCTSLTYSLRTVDGFLLGAARAMIAGFIIWDTVMFLALFAGSAHAWNLRHAVPALPTVTETNKTVTSYTDTAAGAADKDPNVQHLSS